MFLIDYASVLVRLAEVQLHVDHVQFHVRRTPHAPQVPLLLRHRRPFAHHRLRLVLLREPNLRRVLPPEVTRIRLRSVRSLAKKVSRVQRPSPQRPLVPLVVLIDVTLHQVRVRLGAKLGVGRDGHPGGKLGDVQIRKRPRDGLRRRMRDAHQLRRAKQRRVHRAYKLQRLRRELLGAVCVRETVRLALEYHRGFRRRHRRGNRQPAAFAQREYVVSPVLQRRDAAVYDLRAGLAELTSQVRLHDRLWDILGLVNLRDADDGVGPVPFPGHLLDADPLVEELVRERRLEGLGKVGHPYAHRVDDLLRQGFVRERRVRDADHVENRIRRVPLYPVALTLDGFNQRTNLAAPVVHPPRQVPHALVPFLVILDERPEDGPVGRAVVVLIRETRQEGIGRVFSQRLMRRDASVLRAQPRRRVRPALQVLAHLRAQGDVPGRRVQNAAAGRGL
mmetsp:Transcript_2094/g.9496  ORF Transcript_2094/g.9496 Transcript_2094/m.9496 type:complete len:448 (-) Transcript_2094:651-1994(-)